ARGLPPPGPSDTHFLADFGAFRLKRERHGEFDGYTIDAHGCGPNDPFGRTALAELPDGWHEMLPGQRIAAVHLAVLPAREGEPENKAVDEIDEATRVFDGNELCGASIANGGARVYTDFRMGVDGFVRMLVLDVSIDANRTGR